MDLFGLVIWRVRTVFLQEPGAGNHKKETVFVTDPFSSYVLVRVVLSFGAPR